MKEIEDENPDYDSAFAEFSGEDPEKTEAPQPEPDVQTEDSTEEVAKPEESASEKAEENTKASAEVLTETDLWADAPEALKSEHERMKRSLDTMEHKHRSDIGRVSALQRQVNNLQAPSTSLPPSEAAEREPGPLSLTDLENDMPEIARDVRAMIAAEREQWQSDNPSSAVNESLQPVIDDYNARLQQNEYAALEAAHPDFQAIAETEAYWEWVNNQSAQIQALAGSNHAQDVAAGLTIYKSSIPALKSEHPKPSITSSRREKQLAAAESIPSRASSASAVTADDDYEAAFKYFANQK